MTRKQISSLAAVTAMLFMTGIAVWRLSGAPSAETGGSGGTTAILTSSIVLYLMYLFATLPGRGNRKK